MAGETISPNMGLPIPGVSVTSGPQYGIDNNSCFTLIDAHDHTSGNGVLITPDGMSITKDLPFNGFSATTLKKTSFSSQSAALSGTNFASVIGGNLYFNDGSGNQIPITSGGGVAGSPGSIGSLAAPAAATYSAGSKLFTWTADSLKSAAMDNGAVTIRETNVASAKGVTLASASSLAADYQLTLPAALPGSSQYVTSNPSGTLTFSTPDQIAAALTTTGTGSIVATASAADANTLVAKVTRPTGTTVSAGGVAISASCGNFATSSTSYVDVTNLSVTITTSGRPVQLILMSGSITSNQEAEISLATTSSTYLAFLRASSIIGAYVYEQESSHMNIGSLPSFVDDVAAGTYTYKIQMKTAATSTGIQYAKLVAYEL